MTLMPMSLPETLRGEVWCVAVDDFGLPDAGLTRYPESFTDITGLQPVARVRLLERRGLLAVPGLDHLARQLSIYRGLDSTSGGASR